MLQIQEVTICEEKYMMRFCHVTIAVLLFFLFPLILFADFPNEIIYHGKLKESGNVVNGTRNVQFKIFDQASGGTQIGPSYSANVPVVNGIFSYPLNMNGIELTNGNLWIETIVENKILSPREKLTAVAFALHARTAQGIRQATGENIEFVVGNEKRASIGLDGTMSSLAGGTTYYMVPRGAIIMWSGPLSSLPSGWALCNGNNGTPDLTNRFILSVANASENPGETGGTHSQTLSISQLPSHTHSALIESEGEHVHSGTTLENGNHDHAFDYYRNSGGGTYHNMGGTDQDKQGSADTSSDGAHTHSLIVDSSGLHSHAVTINAVGSNAPIDNRPAFYKLAFIMKL